jgi:superfamily I DNA/RNA helicase
MERVKLNGPPGTGKTSYLIDICQREIEQGRAPWEIVFCSFTKAAAHEARDRAKARFGGGDDDYRWFATEHSICFRELGLSINQVFDKRQLRAFGRLYNYDFTGGHDEGDSLEQRYQEGMLKTAADHYEFFASYMNNRMLPFDAAYQDFLRSLGGQTPDGFTRSGLELYMERRERYKQENSLWSFDDMIKGALERRLFPLGARVLILDEAQDCSPLLWELIKFWCSQVESYYIAGDPLQTLYFWAGSNPDLFYSFPGEEHVLGHSYRLTPQVKQFAEEIVRRTTLPFPDFSPSDRDGVVVYEYFEDIDWGGVGDCFVLARTRWLISLIRDHFLHLGIPFNCERGSQSPLATSKGRAFYALVKLAAGGRVSNVELANLAGHTGPPFVARGAKKRVRNLLEGMYGLCDLKDMGFTEAFTSALHNGFEEILCRDIEDYETQYLRNVLKRYGHDVFEREPKVTITTIHGSKGREKPTVFLSPDLTWKVWQGYARDRVPETLVYYVGATRAIDKLVVLKPQQQYSFPLPR